MQRHRTFYTPPGAGSPRRVLLTPPPGAIPHPGPLLDRGGEGATRADEPSALPGPRLPVGAGQRFKAFTENGFPSMYRFESIGRFSRNDAVQTAPGVPRRGEGSEGQRGFLTAGAPHCLVDRDQVAKASGASPPSLLRGTPQRISTAWFRFRACFESSSRGNETLKSSWLRLRGRLVFTPDQSLVTSTATRN